MCAIKLFVNLVIWKPTCVFTRTRNRMNVMCAIKLFVHLVVWHSTSVFTRTRNRTNATCAIKLFVNRVIWKGTCVLNISSSTFVILKVYNTYANRTFIADTESNESNNKAVYPFENSRLKMWRDLLCRKRRKNRDKSDSFDAFINAYAYVYKYLITRSFPARWWRRRR